MESVIPLTMPQLFQTSLWRLQLPDTWKGGVRSDLGAFFRPDGVGQLQVHGFDTIGRYDLLAYARDHSPPGTTFSEVSCGRLKGVAGVRIDSGTLWRTWWLSCRGNLVYVEYRCAAKNAQDESAEVDQILQSFAEA